MRRPSSRVTAPLLALALALPMSAGCRTQAGALAPDAPATGGTTGGGKGPAMEPLAPVTRAVELFSARTLVVVESAGPARVAEVLGRDALVARFPDEHREIVAETVRELGVDALDPKALAAIGVDTNGRMGVAVLSAKPFTWAFYWSVTDAGKFRKHVVDRLRAGGQDVATVPMAGAELVRIDGMRTGLVLRGSIAVLVGQDGEVKGDPALEIATADPYNSLASDRGYRKATGGVAPGDGSVFANVGLLWSLMRPEGEEAAPQPASNWARDELAQAKARGDSKERIAELEQQARDVDLAEKGWADRRRAEQELAEWFLGRMGLMMWSGMAKPGGLVAVGKLEIDPDAGPSKVLRNRAGTPVLAKALARDPAVLVTGAMEPGELLGIFELLLRADGTSWTEAVAEVKKIAGVDLDAEVRPLFTGAAGFAATIDGTFTGTAADGKLLGIAIDLEVSDATKARALLDKVATNAEAERKKKKDTSFSLRRDKRGGWIIDIREWRPVFVSIAGHHLVASTDAELGDRIARGVEGPGPRTRGSALAAASLQGSAFSAMLDIGALGLVTMVRAVDFDFSSASVESPEDAKVPKSKAYKAKLAEVDKAQKAFNDRRAAVRVEEIKATAAVFEPWGALAGSVTEDPSGMVVRGGLFLARNEGVAGALLDCLVAVKAMTSRRDNGPAMGGFEELQQLQNEAAEIRRKDIEAWHKKRGTKPTSVAIPEVQPAEARAVPQPPSG
jgi:hypothetical protein